MEIMKQLSRELMALWRENTEPDMRVNSVTGKEAGIAPATAVPVLLRGRVAAEPGAVRNG